MKTVSIKAELSAIFSITDGDDDVRNRLLGKLQKHHFGFPTHQEIFDRIVSGYSNKGKTIPKARWLAEDISLTDEAKVVLRAKEKPLPPNEISQLVELLDKYQKARIIQQTLVRVAEDMKGEKPINVSDLAASAISDLSKAITGDLKIASRQTCVPIVKDILKGGRSFVETGIERFDRENGGFPNGQVVTIAANTGGGKSAFAIQLALNQYSKGYTPAIWSMEMDQKEIWRRIVSNVSGIAHDHLLLGHIDKAKRKVVKEATLRFRDIGKKLKCDLLTICPEDDLTISGIIPFIQSRSVDIVYVDYISLLKPENNRLPKHEQLGEISRIAKKAAAKLNIPIVLLAQINKEDEIKYSGAIQENSGLTIQWCHDPLTEDGFGHAEVEMKITKARNQRKFTFMMEVDFRTMRFADGSSKAPVSENEKKDS